MGKAIEELKKARAEIEQWLTGAIKLNFGFNTAEDEFRHCGKINGLSQAAEILDEHIARLKKE
jgi:hypothetical protein